MKMDDLGVPLFEGTSDIEGMSMVIAFYSHFYPARIEDGWDRAFECFRYMFSAGICPKMS